MASKSARPALDDDRIKQCHQIVDDLVRLFQETDPAKSIKSEAGKKEKALQALNKVGLLTGILTEWAECQIFGAYYKIAKSPDKWLTGDASDKHENELMWYGNNIPDDAFSNDDHLMCERAAIADILHNTFSRYGRMGWRMSLKESLYALNEGQIEWLLTPTNIRQQGNAYDLQAIKWAAVKHIYKLVGQGWKKTAARQKIAEYCGITLDTVKKWEKEAIRERDRDKNTLKAIQVGSLFVYGSKEAKPELDDKFLLQESLYWNLNADSADDKNGHLKSLSFGVISSIKLDEEYPLESLKDKLLEAGFRKTS
jgi:hypothetical protein